MRRVGMGAAVAVVALGAATQAHALVGAVPQQAPAHQSTGQLLDDGQAVCTASLVGPGWAITAAHCLEDGPRSLRMLAGTATPLALGRVHRVPGGGDLALVEVPEAAELRLPWLSAPTTPGACPDTPWPVTVVGAAHARDGRITRTPVAAPLLTFGECSAGGHLPIIIAPQHAPTAICQGDSGNPVLGTGPDAGSIQAVLVAKVAADGVGACGRDVFAIGFTEPLRTAERLQWLARAATAPAVPRAFTATVAPAPGDRMGIRPAAWQAAPPPGTRVALVGRDGATVRRATVRPSGAVVVRRPAPGTYRLRARTAGGHARWSVPLRIAAR